MIENQQKRNILFGILVFFAIVLGITLFGLLYYGVLIIITACMLGTIINAPVTFLQKYKIPRCLGLIICVFIIVGLFYDINMLVIPKAAPEFVKFMNVLPDVADKFDANIKTYFDSMNLDEIVGQSYEELKNGWKTAALDNFSLAFNKVKEIGLSQFEDLFYGIMCLVMTFYIVIDPRSLEKGFLDPWSKPIRKKLRRCMLKIQKMLFCWALGLLCGCMCVFLLTWLGLSLVHFPYGFFFAVFSGFLNIIPTLGPFISAVVPCILMLIINPRMVIYVLVIYLIVQQIESNFITPMIMKKQLDIHPMVLIVGILALGYYFGAVGCLMAAPILASIKIIYEEFYQKPRLYREKEERKLREKEVQNG